MRPSAFPNTELTVSSLKYEAPGYAWGPANLADEPNLVEIVLSSIAPDNPHPSVVRSVR
jgi:hypothetical protein